MAAIKQSFNGTIDQTVRPYQTYTTQGVWVPASTVVSLKESVAYQFYPFFHPYVGRDRAAIPNPPPNAPPMMLSLIQRLREGGVSELEASDTLYMPQPQPQPTANPVPFTVLPNSTRATLTANASGKRPDGTTVNLTAGTPLTLPDNTRVQVTATGFQFNLPGLIPASGPSGIQDSVTSTIVPDSTVVTLPAGATLAMLTNDGSSVTLLPGASVSLRSGLPLPFFYEDFFVNQYDPDTDNVLGPLPVKNLDFSTQGPYAIYNWEIFFHAPLLIAIHLSQNQQYQDAQK